MKYLNSGTGVCELSLATNRRFKKSDGEWAEESCFVDIVVWGRSGENCNQYVKKGSSILVDGYLKFDSWQTQEGQKRSKLRVVADRVEFGARGDGGGGGGGGQQTSDYGRDFSNSGGAPAGGGEFSGGPSAPEYDSEVPF